jgi:flavin reductase (DIM6/NTAB) family NADH-FMN oxidoreductase RutF
MDPKLMVVAVYEGTQTLENLQRYPTQSVLLQLLSPALSSVVRICGRQSGRQVDKIALLRKRFEFGYRDNLPYFAAAAGVMQLRTLQPTPAPGDHRLFVGEVTWSKNLHDGPILTTDYLRAQRLIR